MLTLEALQRARQKLSDIPEYIEGKPNKVTVKHYANCDLATGMLLHPDHPKQQIESFECCKCELFDNYNYMAIWEEGGTNERFLIIPKSAIVSIEQNLSPEVECE